MLPQLVARVEYSKDGDMVTSGKFIQYYQKIFLSEVRTDWRLYAVEVGERDVDFCYVNARNDPTARIRLKELKHGLRISVANEPEMETPWVELRPVAEGKNAIIAKRSLNSPIAVPCSLFIEKDQHTGRAVFTREYPSKVAELPERLSKLLTYHDDINGFYL